MNSKYHLIFASFVISTLLMIVKFIAYYFTYSSAILTDALESIINVVASGFAFYAIYVASQPRDLNHPYGHGKIEFFSAGLEGVLIILASIFIIFHSIQNFVHPMPMTNLPLGLGIIISGVIINWFLGYYVERSGIKNNSPTLIADGQHLKLDAQSGIILILAVGLVVVTKQEGGVSCFQTKPCDVRHSDVERSAPHHFSHPPSLLQPSLTPGPASV